VASRERKFFPFSIDSVKYALAFGSQYMDLAQANANVLYISAGFDAIDVQEQLISGFG